MPWVRFTKAIRKSEPKPKSDEVVKWRIVTARTTRAIPILGSVGLRAVRRLTPRPPDLPEVAKIRAEVRRRKGLGRAIGLFSLLVLIVAVGMAVGAQYFDCLPAAPAPCLPHGFRSHVAALEFARTPAAIEAIVGDLGNRNRALMRGELAVDFGFIVFYLVLYILLAVALFRASFSPLLTAIVVVAAVCTAGFDVLENVRAWRVLKLPLANLDGAQVGGVLDAAVIKWTFSFVTIALLSLTFRHGDSLSKLLRLLFLLTALAGLVGLISHPLIHLSSIPLLIGLLLLIANGMFRPLRLIRDS